MAKAKKGQKAKPAPVPTICKTCNGFGELADTPEQEPLYLFNLLPAETKKRKEVKAVQGFQCPDCKGSGLRKVT